MVSQLRRYIQKNLSLKDSLWNLLLSKSSVHLNVIKPIQTSPSSLCVTPTRCTDDIVAVPARLSDSERFLLLGANDDENMRILLVPRDGHVPEIQHLSFSFAEARARLEKELEEESYELPTYEEDTDNQFSSEDGTGNEAPEVGHSDQLGEDRNETNGEESQKGA